MVGAGARAGMLATINNQTLLMCAALQSSSNCSCCTGTPKTLDVCSSLPAWWGQPFGVAEMACLLVFSNLKTARTASATQLFRALRPYQNATRFLMYWLRGEATRSRPQ